MIPFRPLIASIVRIVAILLTTVFLSMEFLSAQILLDQSGDSPQRISPTPAAGLPADETSSGTPARSTGPGIIIGGGQGGYMPRSSSSYSGANRDDADSSRSRTPNPLLEDFIIAPFQPARPGMTKEEIVEQKRMDALRRNAQIDAALRKFERESSIQDGLRELLGETDRNLPQVLRSDATDIPELAIIDPAAEPSDPGKVRRETPKDEAGSAGKNRTPTEEEKAVLEFQRKLAEIEKLDDPQQQKRQREILEKQEERRLSWIRRRAEAERGAELFLPPLSLRNELLRDGKCLLFDGQTLFGWRTQKEGPYGGGQFTVRDGAICSDPRHPGLLYTTSQFGDMTLTFEYQTDSDSEVFLLLRTPPSPRDLASSCYTVVLNSADPMKPHGALLGRHRGDPRQFTERDGPAEDLLIRDDTPKSRRWHKVNLQFDGAKLQVMIDNAEPISYFDTKPLGYGYIGLLVTKGNARFRNMVWAPGSSLSLFDVIHPENHWRYRKEGKDALQLAVTRQLSYQLTGGPGVMETKKTFDHFVLQLEYNITFPSGRTGIFFRSRPREEQSGYEISIQNFPRRQDRDTVRGVDAGAFRNRKNARYTRAEDQKWNYLTLVVVDRHFQTWVNGVPVCEFADLRPFSPDAKDGPFLHPGTIQLLAPDSSTNVQFRNIRVAPIKPRSDKPRSLEDRTNTTYESIKRQQQEREKEKQLDEQMKTGR